jgi:rRNA biogenesis protein RRP5
LNVHLVSDEKIKLPIAKAHLSDYPSLCDASVALYPVGSTIKHVLVLSKDARNQRVVLSLKPLLKQAFQDESLPKTMSELELETKYIGYITSVTSFGCFVALPHGLIGVADKGHLSSNFVTNPSDIFQAGQTVIAQVTQVDTEKSRIHFSLNEKKFAKQPDALAYIKGYFKEIEMFSKLNKKSKINSLEIGSLAEVTVKAIKDYGIVVQLAGDVDGLITKDQSKGAKCQVGKTITARILDIDYIKQVVDLSLKPELCAVKEANKSKAKSALNVTIELVKDDYLVLSATNGSIYVSAVKTLNRNESPFSNYKAGQQGTAAPLGNEKLKGRSLAQWTSAVAAESRTEKKRDLASLVGQTLTATISAILPMQLNITLESGERGRVHCTEVLDSVEDLAEDTHQVFASYKKGQNITVKVIGTHSIARHAHLAITRINDAIEMVEASLKPSALASKDKKTREIVAGDKVIGIVNSVEKDCVNFELSTHVRGRLYALQPTDGSADFTPGDVHELHVEKLDARKGTAIVSTMGRADMAEGDVRDGIVDHVSNVGLRVQLGPGVYGMVFITNISDTFAHQPLKKFAKGDRVKCYVLSMKDSKIGLSLRESRVSGSKDIEDPEILSFEDVKENQVYHGYVQNVTGSGLFVMLGPDVVARVQIANLSDSFIKDFEKVWSYSITFAF